MAPVQNSASISCFIETGTEQVVRGPAQLIRTHWRPSNAHSELVEVPCCTISTTKVDHEEEPSADYMIISILNSQPQSIQAELSRRDLERREAEPGSDGSSSSSSSSGSGSSSSSSSSGSSGKGSSSSSSSGGSKPKTGSTTSGSNTSAAGKVAMNGLLAWTALGCVAAALV